MLADSFVINRTDNSVEAKAREIIITHRRLFNRLEDLHFECVGELLTVYGELPTYYQKQLLQTALMQLPDVQIDNQVTVRGA